MSSSVSSSGATIEGIGFAIPMTEAREIVDDLINHGYVTGRPQLGISCQDVSEAVSQAYNLPIGAYIISITEDGAADEAGLQVGDIITAINDNKIQTTEELNSYKNEFNAGDTVTLTIVRNGQEQKIDVVLKEITKNSSLNLSDCIVTVPAAVILWAAGRNQNLLSSYILLIIFPTQTACKKNAGCLCVFCESRRK